MLIDRQTGTVLSIDDLYLVDASNARLEAAMDNDSDARELADDVSCSRKIDVVGLLHLVREVIDDVEAVQLTGEEDVREEWPDLWATYELACSLQGIEPQSAADDWTLPLALHRESLSDYRQRLIDWVVDHHKVVIDPADAECVEGPEELCDSVVIYAQMMYSLGLQSPYLEDEE